MQLISVQDLPREYVRKCKEMRELREWFDHRGQMGKTCVPWSMRFAEYSKSNTERTSCVYAWPVWAPQVSRYSRMAARTNLTERHTASTTYEGRACHAGCVAMMSGYELTGEFVCHESKTAIQKWFESMDMQERCSRVGQLFTAEETIECDKGERS